MIKHSLQVYILRELISAKVLSFTELCERTDSSPGNCHRAIEKLERDGCIRTYPRTERRTMYEPTKKGREDFLAYKEEIWK